MISGVPLFFSYPVKEYVSPVIRCFKWQRLGHIGNVWDTLPTNLRVKKGVQGVEDSMNMGSVPVKCCNCGEQHSAAYKGCVKQIQAKDAQKVKITYKITFAEALKKVFFGENPLINAK